MANLMELKNGLYKFGIGKYVDIIFKTDKLSYLSHGVKQEEGFNNGLENGKYTKIPSTINAGAR